MAQKVAFPYRTPGLMEGVDGVCSVNYYRTCSPHISLLSFSLCLSRACLGKMIIFSIKWHKKTRFISYLLLRRWYSAGLTNGTPPVLRRPSAICRYQSPVRNKNNPHHVVSCRISFLVLSYPTVLLSSLSWACPGQSDVGIEWSPKFCTFSYCFQAVLQNAPDQSDFQ